MYTGVYDQHFTDAVSARIKGDPNSLLSGLMKGNVAKPSQVARTLEALNAMSHFWAKTPVVGMIADNNGAKKSNN